MLVALEEARRLGDERRIYSARLTLPVPTSRASAEHAARAWEALAPKHPQGQLSFWEMYAVGALEERVPTVGFEGQEEPLPEGVEGGPEQVGVRVAAVDPEGPAAGAGAPGRGCPDLFRGRAVLPGTGWGGRPTPLAHSRTPGDRDRIRTRRMAGGEGRDPPRLIRAGPLPATRGLGLRRHKHLSPNRPSLLGRNDHGDPHRTRPVDGTDRPGGLSFGWGPPPRAREGPPDRRTDSPSRTVAFSSSRCTRTGWAVPNDSLA